MNVHQMNERVLPMWTESDKQNKTEENNNKNRTFIKYSWKYSSVSIMVLRRRFRLPLPFCHVIHCIHEIPFWQSNFFFSFPFGSGYLFAFEQKENVRCWEIALFHQNRWTKEEKKIHYHESNDCFTFQFQCEFLAKQKNTYKYRWHSWNEYEFLYIYSSCIERQSTKLKLTTIIYICGRLKYHWFNWWLMDRD